MAFAARAHSRTSSSCRWMRLTIRSYASGWSRFISRTELTAYRRLKRAITFVKRLSLTTVVYSSGPVTPWMWKLSSPLLRRQKPSVAHIRAVSTAMSIAPFAKKPTSPVAWMNFASA